MLRSESDRESTFDIFNHHACGRTTTGSIACWGDNSNGQLNVPASFQ